MPVDLEAYRQEIISWKDGHEKTIAGQLLLEFYKERLKVEQERQDERRATAYLRSQNAWFKEFMADQNAIETQVRGAIVSAIKTYGGQLTVKKADVAAKRATGLIYSHLRRLGGLDQDVTPPVTSTDTDLSDPDKGDKSSKQAGSEPI